MEKDGEKNAGLFEWARNNGSPLSIKANWSNGN